MSIPGWQGTRRHTTIPGPDVIDDLEGHIPDIKASGSLHEFLVDLHARYGDIVAFNFGPQFCVSIASPELFKEHAKVFPRPYSLFALLEPLLTDHCIQYANGADGRRRHQEYARSFTHESMQYYMDTLTKLSNEFTKKFGVIAKEEHIPLGQYMNAFAVKSILAIAFGQYFEGDKEVLEFKKCYDLVWFEMESRLGGETPDPERERKFEACRDKMYAMLMKAYEQAKNDKLPETDHKRFITALIDLELPEKEAKADMMAIAVGGFHTTGLLLTWCTYYLASHEDIQEKVYEELTTVLGDEPITFQAVDQLPYMRQVLDETLRCSILAPFAAREQGHDMELGGHKVPSGTPVVHELGVVLHDENIYPDPERFDPERFSEENRPDIPNFAFEPFGFAGKRKCPGYRLSYYEATVLLSYVLRKFKIKLVEGQVIKKEFGLVTKPVDEIWITLEPRK